MAGSWFLGKSRRLAFFIEYGAGNVSICSGQMILEDQLGVIVLPHFREFDSGKLRVCRLSIWRLYKLFVSLFRVGPRMGVGRLTYITAHIL